MIATPFPEWLIDDTSDISNARIFVVHTLFPRFIGELVPEDEAGLGGIQIGAPLGQIVAHIQWVDDPVFDADALCSSLAKAVLDHDAFRGTISP